MRDGNKLLALILIILTPVFELPMRDGNLVGLH